MVKIIITKYNDTWSSVCEKSKRDYMSEVRLNCYIFVDQQPEMITTAQAVAVYT